MKFNWVVYSLSSLLFSFLYTRSSYDLSEDLVEFLSQGFDTKLNSLISLNMGFSCLVLVVKAIEKLFFDEFRRQECSKLFERLTNYVLIKIVFIVGAIIGPTINELFVWGIWFGIMGFLNLSSLLCRDRFEHLSSINSNHTRNHVRVIVLLSFILLLDVLLFFTVITALYEVGFAVLALLSYECVTVFLNTIQTLTKYLLYLTRKEESWEPKGRGYYYSELTTETLLHLITLVHYCQIFYIHGISLTLIDAVLFLNVRTVIGSLWENFISLKNYRTLAKLMGEYQTLTQEELAVLNDNCAICREPMIIAKRLPCSHVFHESCLQMWLQHCLSSPSCPTCRCLLLQHNHVMFDEPQIGDNVIIVQGNDDDDVDPHNDIKDDSLDGGFNLHSGSLPTMSSYHNHLLSEDEEKEKEKEKEVTVFAETVEQRKRNLQQRKRLLLQKSKKNFLAKQASSDSEALYSRDIRAEFSSDSFDIFPIQSNNFSPPHQSLYRSHSTVHNPFNSDNLNSNINFIDHNNLIDNSNPHHHIMDDFDKDHINSLNNNIEYSSIGEESNKEEENENRLDSINLRRKKMLMAAERRLKQNKLTQSDSSLLHSSPSLV